MHPTTGKTDSTIHWSDTELFLKAVAKGKLRRGAGSRLRALIAEKELAEFGVLACFCCGLKVSKNTANIEHIHPVALGGRTVLENLALSHPKCNEQRGHSATPRAPILATAAPQPGSGLSTVH